MNERHSNTLGSLTQRASSVVQKMIHRNRLLVFMLLLLSPVPSGVSAQSFTTLVTFDGSNGANPVGSLVQGSDGNFYGTAWYGGSSTNCRDGCGTVFRMTPAGTLTTLVNFNQANGANPIGSLVQGTDGNFYGTTTGGGSSTNCGTFGCGTVFRMTLDGTLTTLASFDRAHGWNPATDLVQGTDGNFYGTTDYGGSSTNCYSSGCGTAFRVTPDGTLTTLVNFDNANGEAPNGLVQGSDGDFYGTTFHGGSAACFAGFTGCGTVFRMTTSGSITTLFNFSDSDAAGYFPEAPLVEGSDGYFYGTTFQGGSSRDGTAFRITPNGTLTTLVDFDEQTRGADPFAGLVQGSDGNFYGTTARGGTTVRGGFGFGTVFQMTPAGVLTTLLAFNYARGSALYGGVVQGADGTFYGTTAGGGSARAGTIFRLGGVIPTPTL